MAFHGAHNFSINEANLYDNSIRSGLNGVQYLAQHIASDATHDSLKGDDRGTCHPGTRVDVVDDIVKWAKSENVQKQIYWLHGPAGVGKSVIAQTAAVKLEKEGKLGATFFFSRTDPARNNVSKLFSTIAYKLAISLRSKVFRQAVESQIELDPSIVHQSMKIQWSKLVVDPLKSATKDGNALPISVVLIDGLDECENHNHQLDVLELLDEAEVKGLPLRIIVSSRPEAHIRDSILEENAIKYVLQHSLQVDEEIRLFLSDKFREMAKHKKFRSAIRSAGGTWPTNDDLKILVAKASGQYVYATTVLRYVELGRQGTPIMRLRQIICLENLHESFSDLDILYREILSKCPEVVVPILGLLYIILRKPRYILTPTLSVIDQLLKLEPGEVEQALETLHSLVYIPDLSLLSTWGIAEPYFHHATLEDFLTNKRRSGTYFVDMKKTHEQFLKCCKHSMELIFCGDHVHQPVEGSTEHYSCNLLASFYAFKMSFEQLEDRRNMSDRFDNATFIFDNDCLVKLKDRMTTLLLHISGSMVEFSSESKRKQLEQNCSLETLLVAISSIVGYYLVKSNLSLLSSKDRPRQRLFSNVLDFATCNPYIAGDVKRELLNYTTWLLESCQIVPNIYYFPGTVRWEKQHFADGPFANIYRGSYEYQNLCQKRYRELSIQRATANKSLIFPHQVFILRHYTHRALLPLYGMEIVDSNDGYMKERPIFPFMLTGTDSNLSVGGNTSNSDRFLNNDRLLIIADTIAALKHLHIEGIILRELKPLNILISYNHRGYLSPPLYSLYSEKFFTGKDANDVLHEFEEFKELPWFTEIYAAPEMFIDSYIVNEKSNIYSLSTVIYEILTRRKPFNEYSTVLIRSGGIDEHAIPSFPPIEDSCWAANGGPLTEEIRDLLVECWNQDPNKRPSLDEIYDRMHLADIKDTRSLEDWSLGARFNDLNHSAQFVTTEAIEDMLQTVKEAIQSNDKR